MIDDYLNLPLPRGILISCMFSPKLPFMPRVESDTWKSNASGSQRYLRIWTFSLKNTKHALKSLLTVCCYCLALAESGCAVAARIEHKVAKLQQKTPEKSCSMTKAPSWIAFYEIHAWESGKPQTFCAVCKSRKWGKSTKRREAWMERPIFVCIYSFLGARSITSQFVAISRKQIGWINLSEVNGSESATRHRYLSKERWIVHTTTDRLGSLQKQ